MADPITAIPAGADGTGQPSPTPATTSTPTPDVNAGRTAVTLGNGSTVYYDKTGAAFDASGNAVANSNIAVSTIGNTIAPPTTSGTPAPVPATAPTLADQFHTSLSSTLDNQQSSLQTEYANQTASYQQQTDALTQQKTDLEQLEQNGLIQEGSTVQQEASDKQAALDQYNQEYQSNFDARQKLTDTLSTLLTSGQSIIDNLKATSGLSSIMNAQISQTMATIQGQAGVISTALAAYDSQIGLATTHLTTAVAAITSIYSDQISYWNNVVDFYSNQEKSDDTQIATLTADQKSYVDAQIKTQQDAIATTQATATIIQKAMLDPTTALTYAKAGVSLTDTPDQINQKLAAQAQADQNVWGTPTLVGGDYIQTNKLTGETRTVVSNVAGAAGTAGATSTVNSKGQLSNAKFVELSLERANLQYKDALAKVPAGKVGVIDNATGQIGSITPTDYNTKQYTYL